MSSQDFMNSRRIFMQRSALGAGGLLFSSLLLTSCTDHDIPDPQNPQIPSLFDPQIAWNDDAKLVVTTGLQLVPDVGGFISSLVDIFWPSSGGGSPWDQIKDQVEALVNQQIAAAVYQQVTDDLKGLNSSLILYVNETKNGTPAEILTQWMITKNLFVDALPHFQSAGNELPLLPLFGQFANLYLALLQDGVRFGVGWGRTDADHQQDITDLQFAITDFSTWALNTFNIGRSDLVGKTSTNAHECEPFKTLNTFDRQMNLTVLDFLNIWPYFDITLYPNGTTVSLIREIYSDPYGSCDQSTNRDPIDLQSPAWPTQFPDNLTVWASDRVDAVQSTYPANSGPGGVTQTPRMGVQSGGKVAGESPSQAYTFNLSPDNPIIAARSLTAYYGNNGAPLGPFASGVQFQFHDGTTTNILGGIKNSYYNTPGDTGLFGYTLEALSSVYIHGANTVLGGADCVVFGFMYWQSPAATLRAISAMYVKSTKELSAADFAKAFPKVSIPADLISEELKMARNAYWKSLKERADALKQSA